MEWYAVFVYEGKEDDVQKRLNARFKKSFLTLVPKKHTIFRRARGEKLGIKNLFPGYVFIRTDMDKDKYKIINQMSGVIQLVSAGKDFIKIDDDEIALILKLINKDGIIEISKILKDAPGSKEFTVIEGPLKGMESIITRVDAHDRRAYVLLNHMGDPIKIEVGAKVIYKTDQNFNQ